MPQALALAAQMTATLALIVVLALSLFVLSLAFRANRPPRPADRTSSLAHSVTNNFVLTGTLLLDKLLRANKLYRDLHKR
jgi:hypothetical protein